MSIREFAAHLGVSDRMVSKWEAGGEAIHPGPVNQEALDTSLARCSADVQARFALLAATPKGPSGAIFPMEAEIPVHSRVRHPVDGKLMTLVDAGVFLGCPDTALLGTSS